MAKKDLFIPKIVNWGLFTEHNMPCSICLQAPAVYDENHGFFKPCWLCQKKGWVTYQRSGFLSWLRGWFP